MALNLSKSGIATNNAIKASHVTQSIDALTGTKAYNITISGSLNIDNAPITNLTASGTISASGAITAASVTASGAITAASVTASGAITAASVTTTGNISSSGGNLFGNQATLTGRLNTNLIRGETASDTVVNIEDNINITGNITASGNISASGGFVLGQYFTTSPNAFSNIITMSLPNRIDLSPNGQTAIRLTSSSVSLNKDTSVNGDITSVTNITASGNISAAGNIIGLSGSFSDGLITSGSRTRKIRTVTLTATGTNSLNAAQTVQPDDDIILVVDNTLGAVGGSDFTFNCTDLFYAQASEVGRIVTIANVSSSIGSDLILGAPDPGDDNYTANGVSTSARFDTVCNSVGDEVNIVVIGLKTVAIYGSGI